MAEDDCSTNKCVVKDNGNVKNFTKVHLMAKTMTPRKLHPQTLCQKQYTVVNEVEKFTVRCQTRFARGKDRGKQTTTTLLH